MRRTLIALAVLMATAASAARAEVQPMTRDRLSEAEEVGRRATSDAAFLFRGTCRTKSKHGIHMYEVSMTTPFASIAYAVFESEKRKAPYDLAQWPLDAPGDQSVIVTVDPAALSPSALAIALPRDVATVLLRRGEKTIEPRRSDTHEVNFPTADGKQLTYHGGAYYFPLGAFASADGDLEIVVIAAPAAEGAEAVLKVKQDKLAKLR